jgi:hypothetical protein
VLISTSTQLNKQSTQWLFFSQKDENGRLVGQQSNELFFSHIFSHITRELSKGRTKACTLFMGAAQQQAAGSPALIPTSQSACPQCVPFQKESVVL